MKVRNLSKNEMDAIKIVMGLLEGHDTLGSLAKEASIPKSHIQYILHSLKTLGIVYRKEGTKRWRVQADYVRIWKNMKKLETEEEFLKNPESEEKERTVIMDQDIKNENINGQRAMFVKKESGIKTNRVKDRQNRNQRRKGED